MKRNRASRVECPTCKLLFYTQLALVKHRVRVHGYVPYPTRRELEAWTRQRGIDAGVFKAQ